MGVGVRTGQGGRLARDTTEGEPLRFYRRMPARLASRPGVESGSDSSWVLGLILSVASEWPLTPDWEIAG